MVRWAENISACLAVWFVFVLLLVEIYKCTQTCIVYTDVMNNFLRTIFTSKTRDHSLQEIVF